MLGKVRKFLQYYEPDLTYGYEVDGIENLNHSVCGIPHFRKAEEVEKYITDHNITINILESAT